MTKLCTLHEIAVKHANKQPGMVDSLTEECPILDKSKWKRASHDLWHNAEVLTDIEGAGFIEFDAPIPTMSVSSDLVRTDLHMLAGSMEVPSKRAQMFGGKERYFADKQDAIIKKAGMDTEKRLVFNNWMEAAKYAKNLKDAGAPKDGWFLLAVRFDENYNCGLYDPHQFQQGRFFQITCPYGGQEYHLKTKKYEGVLGYGITYRASFGWMLLSQMAKRTCAAIVNVDEDNCPTPDMIDDMLSDIRAQPGSTFIFCSPKAKTHGINPHKRDVVQMVNNEHEIKTAVDTWNGIPIVTSYNILEKIPHVEVK